MRHPGMCALALLVVLGCGGGSATGAGTTTPEIAAAPSRDWELVPTASSEWLSLQPGITAWTGDAWLFTFGGIRVLARPDGTIERATDIAESYIALGAHLGEHWVFATRTGDVLRSTEPIGPLEVVGNLEGMPLGAVVSHGERLALLDGDGRLFVGDAAGIARVETELPVVDASFSSATFGSRIDLDGSVWATTDGGASWTAVPWPSDVGAPSMALHYGDEEFVLTSTRTWLRIDPPATATRVEMPEPPPSDAPALDESLREDARSLATAFAIPVSDLSASGRMVVVMGDHHVLVPEGTRLALPDASCSDRMHFWGDALIVQCEESRYILRGAGQPFVPFAEAFGYDELAYEPGGDRFAAVGPCRDREESSDEGVVCVVGPAGARDLRIPGLLHFAGLSTGALVALVEGTGDPELRAIDLDTGRATPLPLPGGLHPSTVRVASDGTVWGIADGAARLFVGTPGSPFVVVTPPDDGSPLLRPRVVDRRHIVVAGEGLWLSSDGGASFEPGRGGLDEDALCDGVCFLDGWIWMPAGLDLVPSDHVVRSERAGGPRYHDYGTYLDVPSGLACEMPLPWAGRPVGALAERTARELVGGGGWARLEGPAATPWTEGALAGTAGGVDGRGSFSLRIRGGDVPPSPALDDGPGIVTTELVAVTRELAVFERVRTTPGHRKADLVVASASRAPSVVPLLDLASSFTSAPIVTDVLAQADGSIALRIAEPNDDVRAPSPDVVLVLAPDGTTRSRTFESGGVEVARTLVVAADGRVGLLAHREERTHFLDLDGGITPIEITETIRVSAPCTAPAAGGDLDLVAPFGLVQPLSRTIAISRSRHVDADLRVTLHPDGTACLRAAVSRRRDSAGHDEARGGLVVRAEGGRLVGHVVAPSSSPSVACDLGGVPDTSDADGMDVRVGPLDGGTLGLVLVDAGMTEVWVEGRLSGDAWQVTATELEAELGVDPRFVAGATEPLLFVPNEYGTGHLYDRSGPREITSLIGTTGSASPVELVRDGTTVAAREADGTERGRVDVGALLPLGADLVLDARGRARGVLFLRAEERWGELTFRGVEIGAHDVRLRASVVVRGPDGAPHWVTGDASSPSVIAVRGTVDEGDDDEATDDEEEYEEEDDAARHPSIHVYALDGTAVREVGPPIDASSEWVAMEPLAVTLSPRPRVAYTDAVDGNIPTHVRVVELQRGVWVDVAPAWRLGGAAAATFDGGELVLVDTGRHPSDRSVRVEPRSARLDGTSWTTLTIGTVAAYAEDDENAEPGDEEEYTAADEEAEDLEAMRSEVESMYQGGLYDGDYWLP